MKLKSTYNLPGIAILSVCLMMPDIGSAQQYPISNQFLTNHFVYSPAFAGAEGSWKGNLSYRKEWVGIQGAPITKFINVNGPVGSKGGFGASFITEDIGMLQNFNGSLSYAYHLEVGADHTISFGVNGGFYENRLNLTDVYLDDNTDDVFLNAIGGFGTSFLGTSLEIGAGLNYSYSDATIGVAVPNLLGNPVLYQNQVSNVNYSSTRHYLVHASFQFGILNDTLRFEPILVARFSEKGPLQIEAGVLTKYRDWAWLGLGLRQGGIYFASLGG
ncbi:MAG: PorP/SprF family type IX secretion system membrane protein, partial [Bacteroidetes bacterium]|nr:PorP/SprF family type IX secretion system membrane protein [Bacteroidota bacterium]